MKRRVLSSPRTRFFKYIYSVFVLTISGVPLFASHGDRKSLVDGFLFFAVGAAFAYRMFLRLKEVALEGTDLIIYV
ncbi:MAG: hypothetical protein ABL995_19185 [Bryobacteraceae bacterium]